MNTRVFFSLFIALSSFFIRADTNVSDTQPETDPIVWVAEIRGSINPASADFLKSSIQKAERDRAQALVVELDTPGGLVSSVRSMAQAIDDAQIPVVVYVTPAGASATSAGALLMLASHLSVMAPGTNIGAAHPVGQKGEEIKGPMGEKVKNDVAAFARGLAELRGRDPKVAEEVVSKSKSFTAKEAKSVQLIDFIARDRAALFQFLHGRVVRYKEKEVRIQTEGSLVKTAEMTAGQLVLHYLANPNVAAILMTLAMLLIYVEVSNPGITIAGVLGGICFLIAFMALQVLPIQAGGIALLGLGMILMIAELFVAASGALATGGVLAFVLGLLWMVDPAESDLVVDPEVWIPISIGLSTGVGIIVFAAARTRKLARETLSKIGGGGSVGGLSGYNGVVQKVDELGRTGKVTFRGELWDFLSLETLKEGDTVQADRIEKGKVVVRRKLSENTED